MTRQVSLDARVQEASVDDGDVGSAGHAGVQDQVPEVVVSFGVFGLTGRKHPEGDFYGWYTLSAAGGKEIEDAVPQLDSLAAKEGFDPAGYDLIIYMNDVIRVNRTGVHIDDKRAGIDGYRDIFPWTFGHEALHVFGIDHANGYLCTDASGARVPLGGTCEVKGYDDWFDPQGWGPQTHPQAYFKARMGWLFEEDMVHVPTTVRATRTYTLAPIEDPGAGTKIVRIPIAHGVVPLSFGWTSDPASVPLFYYLDTRRQTGFDAVLTSHPEAFDSATLRVGTDYDTNHMTLLVDTTVPAGGAVEGDEPLSVGETFWDGQTRVRIRTLSAGPAGVEIEVVTSPRVDIAALLKAAATAI